MAFASYLTTSLDRFLRPSSVTGFRALEILYTRVQCSVCTSVKSRLARTAPSLEIYVMIETDASLYNT